MVFIFNDTQGMQTAATGQTGWADQTAGAGTQSQAAGLPVTPPGGPGELMGPVVTAAIKGYTSQVASLLAAGSQLQGAYSQAITNSANGYLLIDELHSAALSTVSAPGTMSV